MTNSGEASGGSPGWAARIRREDGEIAGAGVLVAADRVLTCARILAEQERYTVEFALGEDGSAVPARVDAGAWVPRSACADGRPGGDVALLRLTGPRPSVRPGVLRRMAAVRRAVRVHGMSEGPASAEVLPGAGGDGRVRLRRAAARPWADGGWRGAGAVDEVTGALLGIVLGEPDGFTWLVPAETLLRHLPGLAAVVSGPPAVPREWTDPADPREPDAAAVRLFTGWAARGGPPVVLDVLPEPPAGAGTLRACLTAADRERHGSLPAGHPLLDGDRHELPPVGAFDLALDADGASTDRIAELVVERLGLPDQTTVGAAARLRQAGVPPLRLVVTGVDRAAEPTALLDLLGSLVDGGSRLLLLFRAAADETRLPAATELAARARRAQLDRTRRLLTEIAFRAGTGLRDRVARVSTDTAELRHALIGAASTRAYLAERPERRADSGEPEDLGAYERLAEDVWLLAGDTIERLDRLILRRNELRGTLTADRALDVRTTDHEDREADRLYLAAHDILYRGSCDVDEAGEAVLRYTDYVEARGASPADKPGGGEAS